MTKFYFLFAFGLFGIFCFLEWRGTSFDDNQFVPAPYYHSYRGGGAASTRGYYGGRSRSYGHRSYSHK